MRRTEVRSDITGSVSVHRCDDGAQVTAGEVIAEIECMKTLYGVAAPCGGTVHYRAQLGEVVAPDQVVAIIEGD